jgi:hypothetical protein
MHPLLANWVPVSLAFGPTTPEFVVSVKQRFSHAPRDEILTWAKIGA